MTLPVNTAIAVKLDGTGAGTVKLGPVNRGQKYVFDRAAVSTSTAVNVPQCAIYIGATATANNFVDGTVTGNFDSTDHVSGIEVTLGNYIWAVWSGGDIGAIATLSLYGTLYTGNGS